MCCYQTVEHTYIDHNESVVKLSPMPHSRPEVTDHELAGVASIFRSVRITNRWPSERPDHEALCSAHLWPTFRFLPCPPSTIDKEHVSQQNPEHRSTGSCPGINPRNRVLCTWLNPAVYAVTIDRCLRSTLQSQQPHPDLRLLASQRCSAFDSYVGLSDLPQTPFSFPRSSSTSFGSNMILTSLPRALSKL